MPPIEALTLGPAHLARARRGPGEHVVEHDRPALALSFVALPGSEIVLRGADIPRSIVTRRGTHCLMPPGTRVEGRWRSSTDYLLTRFDPVALADVLGRDNLDDALRANTCAEDAAVLAIGTLIAGELDAGTPRGRLYLESLTTALMLVLLPGPNEPARRAYPDPRIRRALEYLHANLAEDLSIDDLAAQACLSRFHFTRLFTSEVGRSPYRYLLDARLEIARSLLARTALPVAEVARRCGFKSAAHFARMVARETGATPTEYRRRL
jgi:AraC family transcriptional regulator